MAGYLAHWKESLDDPDTKIMRPQQVSNFTLCYSHFRVAINWYFINKNVMFLSIYNIQEINQSSVIIET